MSALLHIEDLHVAYGSILALKGVSISVDRDEIVAVIGANGAGKSTLLRTIAGLNTPRQGSVVFDGHSILGRAPERLVAGRISTVPEGRHIFGSLSVAENLALGATPRTDGKHAIRADLDRMLTLFPILRRRLAQRAGQLSGGEQQMLAIARALMAKPVLLLLDEPSLGLAPIIVATLYDTIAALRADGLTVLVVEQNFQLALRVADRAYVLDTGRVALAGPSAELRDTPQLAQAYFGAVG